MFIKPQTVIPVGVPITRLVLRKVAGSKAWGAAMRVKGEQTKLPLPTKRQLARRKEIIK